MSAISMESLTFKDFVSKGQFEVYKSTLPTDHLARAAVEIMQRIRDAGVDHDKWLQDLKVACGWEEDPLKLLHAIAGYESCWRCTIDVQTGEFKAKKETELAVTEEIRARIKSFLESQWTTFEKLCSSAKITKAGMAVAQLAAKHRLAIGEFAEGILETRKAEAPKFVPRAMGALALFDNFKWIIIREGHKLNLVTADASDGIQIRRMGEHHLLLHCERRQRV